MAPHQFKTQSIIVPQLETLIGYTFNDQDLGWEALQTKNTGGYKEGNKRLALLGDAVLKMKVYAKWYPTLATVETGHNLISMAAQNANLTVAGQKVGLDKLVCINQSQWNVGVTANQIADAIEAVIGAVYFDGGEDSLEGVIERLKIPL